ncbi:hypothetical protein MAR_033947 [Mya arenaria]|uniref:DZIP3-like HEPN domain-containing protein n=1 Tax=Mya arenaria TaxID=6604 RepID=A0ABY7GAG2_MYAAR|nr:hypothetical protein MAR_033947 [Mya arenaria]
MISNTDVQALRKDEENWVRTIIGLNATKTCLAGFAEDVMLKLREHARNEVVKRNRLCKFVSCSQCSIADLLPCPTYDVCFNKSGACKFHVNTPKVCPNSVCNVILEYIIKSHRHHSPSWRNTEPSLWFTNSWEIAKCFLPPDGYKDVKSAEETDFDGIACVIKNCLMFENVTGQNMARSNSSLSKALAVSRGIISSTSLHVTDEQMTSDLHILESLLTDTKCLKERKATKTALQTIKKKKEISYGYADKTGPLQKKQKISNSRQLRSAHSSHGYCSAPETIIIDKDIHKWFSVYIHACADVREINITTDSILCALGITHIAEVNRTFVSNSVVVRLIFMIDHTTMDLMEIFRSIRKKVDGGCKPLSLREENNFSTIYIGSRQNIQMEEIKPCTNAGLLFYGLQEEFVQNCNDLVFDVTNTKDTNAFLEKLDDILERITIKTLRKKTEALVLLKSQIYDNADNKPFYELIESELTKLGFCISRNMNNGEICDAQASTSGTVYKLRSTEKKFFQNVVSRKSEIDQQLCCLKALYARSGVPEDEKPTFPQGNISWNIEKVNAVCEY